MNWTAEQLAQRNREQGLAPGLDRLLREATAPSIKPKGRVREPRGQNKTEARYHAHLTMLQRSGDVAWFRFEFLTLKLADDTRLTPDFTVMLSDGEIQLHDCKVIHRGQTRPHIEDDALAKMRVAAESPFRVFAVWPLPSGEWGKKEY